MQERHTGRPEAQELVINAANNAEWHVLATAVRQMLDAHAFELKTNKQAGEPALKSPRA
jgi:glycine betaine/choline ABC-type transport system substrate-binding protein